METQQLLLLSITAGIAVLLFVLAIGTPKNRDSAINISNQKQYRPRVMGNSKMLESAANSGARRALAKDATNAKYLRQLKQANWYWEVGEPTMPNPLAPFWNLETLWGEKLIGAILWGIVLFGITVLLGGIATYLGYVSLAAIVPIGIVVGLLFGYVAYVNPDSLLAAAAARRQREISLEMGFRLPELRADVLSGSTIQRAMRAMSRRPGGPFVEELRRAVGVLDITRDEMQAMDYLTDRSQGNDLMQEFCNSVKMVSRQGGQIAPVLNVVSDLAQQRLRLAITSQARKNLQEMTRPISLTSLVVTSLLIIVPAMASILQSFTAAGR